MPGDARVARVRILSLFGSRVLFGAERENIEVLSALQRGGAEILCLVRHESWNTTVPSALEARGFTVRRAPYLDSRRPGWTLWILLRNPFAFVIGNWQCFRAIRAFKPTHIHTFNAFYAFSFLPALSFSRAPLIYRAGDVPVRHRWIWRAVWRRVVRRTHRFLAVSRFIAAALEANGVDRSRIEVIYGIPPARALAASHVGVAPSHHQDFVYLGQIIPAKGVDVAVDAFERIAAGHPDSRLIIAGRISDEPFDAWARALRDRVSANPVLGDRIVFTGFTEDVPGLLQNRLALVVPSQIDEALGLVVLEAKAAGLPAIVSPKGALPELVRSGIDGLVCRNMAVDGFAEAMSTYLGDPALATKHGQAARASVAGFVEGFEKKCADAFSDTLT